MIPARLAIAMQDNGWILRSEIIWHKPNPMPESVTDRPTKAHEMIYMFAKSARYFWDADAVREKSARPDLVGNAKRNIAGVKGKAAMDKGKRQMRNDSGRHGVEYCNPLGRNVRDVWTITSKPLPEAHFAAFPPDLVERCIKAGSRPADVVLDPFGGAGTVAMVAESLGRDWITIELNPEYIKIIKRRVSGPLFAGTA
jgi:site-specific DNA-methyltransferase (cytosine-N4-specific)